MFQNQRLITTSFVIIGFQHYQCNGTVNKEDRKCAYKRNIVVLSPNHCCNGNTKMRYVCIVELQVSTNNLKILGVAKQCFYGE
jgi:hypothetical protein